MLMFSDSLLVVGLVNLHLDIFVMKDILNTIWLNQTNLKIQLSLTGWPESTSSHLHPKCDQPVLVVRVAQTPFFP